MCKGISYAPSSTNLQSALQKRQLKTATDPQTTNTIENQTTSSDIQPTTVIESQVIDNTGCNQIWEHFFKTYLWICFSVSFGLIPICLMTFIIAILSANHIYDWYLNIFLI